MTLTPVVTLTFDPRSWNVVQVLTGYEVHLSTKYEVNPSIGLGGVRGQTDRQTYIQRTLRYYNIDIPLQWYGCVCHVYNSFVAFQNVINELVLALKIEFANVIEFFTSHISLQSEKLKSKGTSVKNQFRFNFFSFIICCSPFEDMIKMQISIVKYCTTRRRYKCVVWLKNAIT